jgi:hypothetical protein
MTESTQNDATVFGVPLSGFGFISSLLLAFAAAFFTFFLFTAVSIFVLLGWNLIGHHTVNFADSYLYIGLPAGVGVLLIALPTLVFLWLRNRIRA